MPHVFAGHRVDRAAERRRDPAWLRARLVDPATRVVPVLGLKSLVTPGDPPRAVFLSPTSLPSSAEPVFLGELDGDVYFAVELDETTGAALEGAAGFVELRPLGALLDAGEAAMLA